MKRIITLLAIAVVLTGSAFAQSPRENASKSGSNVIGAKSAITHSLKSRGFIGRYEIVTARERGLFGPSTVVTFIYDPESGSLTVVNPASSPGIGVAAVNGGSLAGAAYLFGASRKADSNNLSSGSSSTATASGSGTASGGGNVHNNNNGNQHNH